MSPRNKIKVFFLFLGDMAVFYAALFITLVFRYGQDFYNQFTISHAFPFSLIFIIWVFVFFIAGLYELRRLRNNLDFLKTLLLGIFINSLLATLFFYFLP